MDENQNFFNFDNISLEALHTHLFFGAVDVNSSLMACNFILKSNLLYANAELNLVLNTTGGDCSEAFAVIDTMNCSRLPIHTTGIGSIMSMGVLLLAAGHKGKRRLTKNSEVMAHQFAASFYGKQHELMATSRALKLLENRFKRHFLNHTKMTEQQIKDIVFAPSDRYLTPSECKKFGICDEVIDSL
jgi:ATP-dependent Clp protease protease subunit